MSARITTSKLRLLAALVFGVLVTYFLVHNWSYLEKSLGQVRGVSPSVFLMGLPLELATFVFATLAYQTLAFVKLRFIDQLLVELAASFINRLLPAGIGGLGMHGAYLVSKGQTVAQSTAVISINSIMSTMTHGLLLLAAIVFSDSKKIQWYFDPGNILWITLALAALAVVVLNVTKFRKAIAKFGRSVLRSFMQYRSDWPRLARVVVLYSLLNITYLTILYLIANDFGLSLGLGTLFIVYTAGVIGGTVVPTPGGLAGVEAGLAGGLVAYGVEPHTSIAVALTFRIITYWLPLVPGAIAFYVANRRKLFAKP